MAAEASHLTLLLPRLPALAAQGEAPALARLLARAEVSAVAPLAWPAAAFEAFGISALGPAGLPVAAVTRAVDLPGREAPAWLRLDPVHLSPTLNDVTLLDAPRLALEPAEARALVAEVNARLADPVLKLEVGLAPARWYVALDTPPDFQAESPASLAGRGLRGRLPQGPDALAWQRFAGEVQMALHECEVNQRRQRAGRPVVNGVWCWGGGATPKPDAARWSACGGGDPVLCGLAALAGVPGVDLDALLGTPGGRLLAFCTGESALEGLEALETTLPPALAAALAEGRCAAVDVLAGARRFRLTRAGRWRFWRRGAPLAGLLG